MINATDRDVANEKDHIDEAGQIGFTELRVTDAEDKGQRTQGVEWSGDAESRSTVRALQSVSANSLRREEGSGVAHQCDLDPCQAKLNIIQKEIRSMAVRPRTNGKNLRNTYTVSIIHQLAEAFDIGEGRSI
jgi:hypothetical protein